VVELRLDAVFTSRKSGRQLPMTVVEHYRVHDGKIYGADAFYKDTQAVIPEGARPVNLGFL
jgi:hypothetical protein